MDELNLIRCVSCYTVITVNPNKIDSHGNLMALNLNGSCHKCSNLDIINASDKLGKDRLIDEVFLQMIRTRYRDPENGVLKRKYEEQARFLLFRIPVYKPTPFFILHYSDILDDKIKHELTILDYPDLNDVMQASIGRIFECINERQFNLSVRNQLRWKIEP